MLQLWTSVPTQSQTEMCCIRKEVQQLWYTEPFFKNVQKAKTEKPEQKPTKYENDNEIDEETINNIEDYHTRYNSDYSSSDDN